MAGRLTRPAVRRFGVEEELLLVDVESGGVRPLARELLAGLDSGLAVDRPVIKHEFYLAQLEVTTSPHAHIAAAREELTGARARIAKAAARHGVTPVAVPGPVLAIEDPGHARLSPGDRYASIARHYGEIARASLMCAMQVHVEVTDPEEGVGVIDRVRPWIPILLAMSANSPFWHGRDVGYDSWRSRVWSMWPTSGPAELFGSARRYRDVVHDMVARGAALDMPSINFDVRLSHHHPTVEFRIADVCTDIDDAMLLVALVRALTTYAAEQWRAQQPIDPWRVDELRTAAWRAARFGVADTLVSPVSHALTDALDAVEQLLDVLRDPLEAAGDTELAQRGLARLRARGNGAAQQRVVWATPGDLAAVVHDLRARTLMS